MSRSEPSKDLVCLVADKNMEQALRGLLSRPEALKIDPPTYDLFVHPESDPGCCRHGVEFLRSFSSRYERALLCFDFEGCGREDDSSRSLTRRLEKDLSRNGWNERARAIVIDPELEVWVWSDSPEVDTILGWTGTFPGLRPWLEQQEWLESGAAKPKRPKEAMEAALREVRRPRSSATFRKLAETVSFLRCQDRAFLKLKKTLRLWFPADRISPE